MNDQLKTQIEIDVDLEYRRMLLQVESENRPSEKLVHSVKARVEQHKLWLESNGKEGSRFQAQNENLTGIDFSRKDLRKAEFRSCILDYCNFYASNLSDKATLMSCSIKKARLDNADFSSAVLIKCQITDSSFRNAKFSDAHIEGTYRRNTGGTLSNNNFENCLFDKAVFIEMNLYGSLFKGARIELTSFNICDMSHMDFSEMDVRSSIIMRDCFAPYTKLKRMLIDGSVITSCNLTNAIFEKSSLVGSDFSRSILTRTNFRHANLSTSRFNMTLGESMNFFGADINNSEMRLSSFREANFLESKINESDLSGSDLVSALINETTIKHYTNFSGCTWVTGRRCKVGSNGVCYEEE